MTPLESHRVNGARPAQERPARAAGPGQGRREIVLAGLPSQVSRARALVTAALGRDDPLHDDCLLLTSELATNAVLHSRSGAGGSFTVAVRSSDELVRVYVADAGSDGPPCVCRTGAGATTGRGLPLVDALSHRWGFARSDGSTTVWFELLREEGKP
ncbi:ATP-binding protein [Nonomuraea pusilla]|uniref:Anti-sigma regulatory factor (Ser/Thr protein kinase) n=1 Tax=Nonomuraea pusilla TaxID=46177 RepID=A0A1H7XJE3_9ACTN|nr:ATP-binding protein [Nonomuraea pusilla]SEM33881.1 Anti-sigma regulatory factor (Ser/Thr protein kinase) [Nonomuraea pusilla]